ncbi:MAG TPA: adenylate/guanylate cyclase domain-containing protein [Alphaproteobacteria bacterium]|jgi:adenylate cyclase|nr:adenylate/guanylate cyclase domain-containing protein [Alphaproteobacteria bacterium]MDP6269828.1 adenylate/guanylate cyclase domain-containing protein [Alphaproteobacteria bacterium]MDP7164257.1 adenylate/guanylate cyclase domain-containing protein [Alphaproteobacteria bacterium]MDP7428525.1 adenylate/guanylate cyclase domain-containing protein [Alphaproteobacteria bacterium]HJM49810.1 adenylate/guanylate cyclase domain-containing protein [Alphaproteobacteria bacterium]
MTGRLSHFLFGPQLAGQPPERVLQAIAAARGQSEILIGWVQLGVVAAFGTLYALAPKTFEPDAEFVPVPWALGLYLGFTLLRLALAYRRTLPGWFLALSVIIDMALLMGLIWSFHIQYMQPAAIFLKAPTLLYVFIFIALRALRFEPGLVLLAGAAGAVGWLGLVLAVLGSGSEVTRDYVHYLTSNSVLVGAEFDKVISIAAVTLILALAIERANRLLARAASQQAAAADLSRFFAPDVARQITEAEERIEPGHGSELEIAVLMIDIRGFTAFSAAAAAADDVMALLAEYQRRLAPVIRRHQGSIDKFLGDGIMATFGAAPRTDAYAADAVRAVDELLAVAADWQAERAALGHPPLGINAALAVGPVIFGAVGDERRLEYTVIGEPVNLAAKLEKHNKTASVRALTTKNSYAQAQAQGYRPPAAKAELPGSTIEGLTEPVDLIVLGD